MALVALCATARAVGGATPPAPPLILIHGINSSAVSWEGFAQNLVAAGWVDGGCPEVDGSTVKNSEICSGGQLAEIALAERVVYRVNFSHNSNLTLYQQALELSKIVDQVIDLNPGKSRVSLVGHSMGGLAARSYVQQVSGGSTAVQHLITVGTPHRGAHIAEICAEYPLPGIQIVCGPAGSIALAELDPDSAALQTLNDFEIYPLPGGVSYTAVVVGGGEVLLSPGVEGDGIVPVFSQDLAAIPRASAVPVRRTNRNVVAPNSSCDLGIFQTHTCEPNDAGIWSAVLEALNTVFVDQLEAGDPAQWSASSSAQGVAVRLNQAGPGGAGKDIWTTSVFAYDNSATNRPGGGLDNGIYRVGGWADSYYTLIQFDVTALPPVAASAKLRLFCLGVMGNGTTGMLLDRVTSDWDWRIQGTGRDRKRLWWADRPSTVLWSAAALPAPVGGQWYEVDIAELYNGWRQNQFPNYGLQLRPVSTSNRWNQFYSSENNVGAAYGPVLVIVPD